MVLTKNDIRAALLCSPPLIEGFVDQEVQLQPNGVDLTINGIYTFQNEGVVDFSNRERKLPETLPISFGDDGLVHLLPGHYLVSFNEIVNMPNNMMALGRPRSSLLRMGASLHTAVWDAGYCGRSKSLLVVYNTDGIKIYKSARILQLVFIYLNSDTERYRGIYNGE